MTQFAPQSVPFQRHRTISWIEGAYSEFVHHWMVISVRNGATAALEDAQELFCLQKRVVARGCRSAG